jgi:hypothetical protein
MTPGWIESDVEPPHRSEENEAVFRRACQECPNNLSINTEPISGLTFVKCVICTCPLKWVVHRYGACPANKVPPPEIP